MQQGNDIPKASESALLESKAANLSSLDCAELATTRLEIYIPREGVDHRVLDSVGYYCAAHVDAIMEVIGWDASDDIRTVRTGIRAADADKRCGTGFDFTPATDDQIVGAYEVGREVGVRSVEAEREMVREETRNAVARIGAKMDEWRELKAQHAFTVVPDETRVDTWLWICRCGETITQLPSTVNIQKQLRDHAQSPEVEL